MSGTVHVLVDGLRVDAPDGMSVAAVLMDAGITRFRTAVGGSPRAPLCGMGVCYECRVTIDGVAHRRACIVSVADGMQIITAGEERR
jgi:D-hydroxyproline dehydrogenase subunit gamma